MEGALSVESGNKEEAQSLVPKEKPLTPDEIAKRRRKVYLGLFVAYLVIGFSFYGTVEDWHPTETLVFTLSVLTGCGYGHIIPATKIGLVFTAFFIVFGMVIFATFAGEVLDLVMAMEIDALASSMKAQQTGTREQAAEVRKENKNRMLNKKRRQFLVGVMNLSALLLGAFILFVAVWGEDVADGFYHSFVSVLKLDSICLADAVTCSAGWHTSGGGNVWSLTFTIAWYVLTYGTIGHFLVATSTYLGLDSDEKMSKLDDLDEKHLDRMDADNDGKVSRAEFLRDRLVQAGMCTASDVDAILKNFDDLDITKTGFLSQADIK